MRDKPSNVISNLEDFESDKETLSRIPIPIPSTFPEIAIPKYRPEAWRLALQTQILLAATCFEDILFMIPEDEERELIPLVDAARVACLNVVFHLRDNA